MRWMLVTVATVSVLFWSGSALWAQDAPKKRGGPGQLFERLDKNGDGVITADEIPEERRAFFDKLLQRLDKNGDGKISRDELAQARGARRDGQRPRRGEGRPGRPGRGTDRPKRPGRGGDRPGRGGMMRHPLLLLLDANRDGKVTQEEMLAAFKKLDRNGDGVITASELPTPRFAGRGGRPRQFNPEMIVQRLMRMDKNGDGKLTKDEVPERMQRMIERADANGDGAVDKQELLKAFSRFQGRRPGQGRPQRRPEKKD